MAVKCAVEALLVKLHEELKLLTRRTKIPSQPEPGNFNYSSFFSFFNRIVESTIPVPQTVNNDRLSLLRRRVSCLIKINIKSKTTIVSEINFR
jgi:hypothetical protein